jgi:NAD(P)-dependent dehydrogenase (short-subunit alcohol dehydrogenase family)
MSILTVFFTAQKRYCHRWLPRRYGKIVSVASIVGFAVGFPNLVHYSASKAAIAGFTKSLALEVAPHNINVNAVAPGPIDVSDTMRDDPAVYEQLIKTMPIGRMGKPADIATVVAFLASEEANFITGQTIVADGGYVLP